MMREIKFRAWMPTSNKLTPAHMIGWNEILKTLNVGYLLGEGRDVYEVMQFTGLKDRNGVEIYQGDILVKVNQQTGQYKFGRFPVVWNSQSARYNGIPLTYDCEVIGNIYENGDLLCKHLNFTDFMDGSKCDDCGVEWSL